MKKKTLLLSCLVLTLGLTSCHQQKSLTPQELKARQDSIARATRDSVQQKLRSDSIAKAKADSTAKAKAAKIKAQAEQDAQAKAIIRKLFGMSVGFIEVDENYLRNHCTDKMLSKLTDDYEYDGFGYAIWDFRTGMQDGDGPSKMVSIKSLGDNWYRYDFLDMGFKGAKKVHFVYENGDLMLDKLVTLIEPEA